MAAGSSIITVHLDLLEQVRQLRHQVCVERNAADLALDPALRDDYNDATPWRITDLLDFLEFSPNSISKLWNMRGPDLLPQTQADVNPMAGYLWNSLWVPDLLPPLDYVVNHNPDNRPVIEVKRILPAWMRGTIIRWTVENHRILRNPQTGTYTPNRRVRTGRPVGSKNRPKTVED
jgi:hypothetical protein